jgi:hypothetical protein
MARDFWETSASSSSLSNAGSFKEYKDIKANIKKGDLIDIFRCQKNGIPYSHWAIFEKKMQVEIYGVSMLVELRTKTIAWKKWCLTAKRRLNMNRWL